MDAIVYLFSKFSSELLSVQIALLSLVGCLSLYFWLARRSKSYTNEWVPAALVKSYLDKVDNDEREIRMRLFGIESPHSVMPTQATQYSATPVQQVIVQGTDPAVMRELEALRVQLGTADMRTAEFDRMIQALKAEKAALEQKLSAAPAAATSGGANPVELAAAKKEADDLKAKLAEYEVIEDDLANLKKYQIENKQLQEKISTLEKGGVTTTTISATPAAPAATTVVSGSPVPAATTTTVSGATPAEAPKLAVVSEAPPVATPAPAAVAPTPAVAAPVAAPAAEAAPAATGKAKEEDLLSEFEKMLAS